MSRSIEQNNSVYLNNFDKNIPILTSDRLIMCRYIVTKNLSYTA